MASLTACMPGWWITKMDLFYVGLWAYFVHLLCITSGLETGELRLTGGETPNEGRLEVRLSNITDWHGICLLDTFYPLYASLICQDLTYRSACEILSTNDKISLTPTQNEVMSDILTLEASCLGLESSLWECANVVFRNYVDNCKAGEDVWLVCLSDPSDLEVRLSSGTFEGEGYLEMRCPGQKWSTVCADNWDMRDANALCRQLGYPWSYSTTPQLGVFDIGTHLGDIVYGSVTCTGNEDRIGECAFTLINECNSFNSAIAGVQCGVEFNLNPEDVRVALCSGHYCENAQSTAVDSDPRQHCRCDCKCARFNDCCFNFSDHSTSCNTTSDTVVDDSPDYSDYEKCVPVPGSETDHTAYVLISKCPLATASTDRNMCEMQRDFVDVIGLLPVFDLNGVVYKNIYCAICHGLSVQDVSQWAIRLNFIPLNNGSQYINPSLFIVVSGEVVGFEVGPFGPEAQARRCPFGVTETCPSSVTDADLKKACAAYFAPVTYNNTLYRNPHCAICNGIDVPETQYCSKCAEDCPRDPFLPCFANAACPRVNFQTIHVQFSLDAFFDGVYGDAEIVSCSPEKIYDPFLGQCTDIPCTLLYNRTTDCDTQTNPEATTTMNVVSSTMATATPTLFCLFRQLGLGLRMTGIVDIAISTLSGKEYSQSLMSNCAKAAPMLLSLVFEDYDNAFRLVEALETIITASNTGNDRCPVCNISTIKIYLKRKNSGLSRLSENCKLFFSGLSSIHPGLPDEALDSLFLALATYNLTDNVYTNIRAPEYCVEELNQHSCVTTLFNRSEYKMYDDVNKTIWLFQYNMSLEKKDYVLRTAGTVQICSSLLLTPWSLRTVYELAVVACTGLSVVALITTFLIYCAYSGLRRDIIGKCFLNMIAALLIGLLISILSDFFLFHFILCTTVAAISHFAWLGAYTWLALFASVIAIGVDDRQKCLYCKMFVSGWIVPAIAIGVCLWIHFCQCVNVQISYGSELRCWLQGFEALLFSLDVPIVVLLLVSLVAFVCGVIRLRKVREYITAYSEDVTESTVSDVIIFIAMCLLLLIPWVLEIIYLLLDIAIIKGIYQIAFSLQGVVVCAALICNGKVHALCIRSKPAKKEDAPSGVKRQLSKRLDAPDGASNRVWMKRGSIQEEGRQTSSENTCL